MKIIGNFEIIQSYLFKLHKFNGITEVYVAYYMEHDAAFKNKDITFTDKYVIVFLYISIHIHLYPYEYTYIFILFI